MCTARLFSHGGRLLALKFYLNRVVPINHSWRQKTRDTELPDGEDRIALRSLVLTKYRSVTDRLTDRRTDGQTDGYAVTYTAACKVNFAARCNNPMSSRSNIVVCIGMTIETSEDLNPSPRFSVALSLSLSEVQRCTKYA